MNSNWFKVIFRLTKVKYGKNLLLKGFPDKLIMMGQNLLSVIMSLINPHFSLNWLRSIPNPSSLQERKEPISVVMLALADPRYTHVKV